MVSSWHSPTRQAQRAARQHQINDAEASGAVLSDVGAHRDGFTEPPVNTGAVTAVSVAPIDGGC